MQKMKRGPRQKRLPRAKAQPNERRKRKAPRRRIEVRRVLPVLPVEVRRALPVLPVEMPASAAGSAMRILTLNRQGDDVARWQQFLLEHGFNPGPVDGFFGGATRLATIAFQKQNHLTPDGIVGGRTRAAAGPIGFVAAVAGQVGQAIHGLVHDEDDVIDHIGGVPISKRTMAVRSISRPE